MFISENTCIIKGIPFKNMSSNAFFDFCQANESLKFERDHQGNVILMSPTYSLTSAYNSELVFQLQLWNKKHKLGIVFESNGGFTLPDQSQRAADVAWVSYQKWNNLSVKEKEKFANVCPDFVIELKSQSDRLSFLQEKMEMWMRNGTLLGILIDPDEEKSYVYAKNEPTEILEGFEHQISGKQVLPGFLLNLNELKLIGH